jgi:hypothetical protein
LKNSKNYCSIYFNQSEVFHIYQNSGNFDTINLYIRKIYPSQRISMPTCPFCNASNPPDVGLCKQCGGAIPLEEPTGSDPSEFDQDIIDLIKGHKKIEAIKLYRQKTGLGLKEAKDAVEAFAEKHGIEIKGSGCAGVVLLFILLPLAWRLLS